MSQTAIYAQALVHESRKNGADASSIVRALMNHLKSKGREKLLPGIMRELHRMDARALTLEACVEVADEREAPQALRAAREHGIHADIARVNPSLIKGWRASGNGTLIDSSAKRALIDLYRNVTS